MKKTYYENFKEQHSEEVRWDTPAPSKLDTTVTEGDSVIAMYQNNKITKEEMKRILTIMEINGLNKDQLYDVPYSVVSKLWGIT